MEKPEEESQSITGFISEDKQKSHFKESERIKANNLRDRKQKQKSLQKSLILTSSALVNPKYRTTNVSPKNFTFFAQLDVKHDSQDYKKAVL